MQSSLISKKTYDNHSQESSDHSEKPSSVFDYITLMKPRVMILVVFTGFCGMIIAPNNEHIFIQIIAILAISLGAGSAAAINMSYDTDIDTIMLRTQKRPTVRGIIDKNDAMDFGIILALVSVVMMAFCVNILSACLLAVTILYYVFIYTVWLKRTTIQNVVIGGISGALPPLIGWTAVNPTISIEPLILVAIIFLWTPPHSWALALFRKDEYAKCNVPMMPVIKGLQYTYRQILIYSILMVLSSFAPYFLNMVNITYLCIVAILNIIFIYYAISLFYTQNHKKTARHLFFYSIFYLLIIFIAILVC